jgi:hypothetical protein
MASQDRARRLEEQLSKEGVARRQLVAELARRTSLARAAACVPQSQVRSTA